MNKLLYVTECNIEAKIPNGGELVSINNLNLLKEILGTNVLVYSTFKSINILHKIKKLLYFFLGFYYPYTFLHCYKIFRIIKKSNINTVYIDNSRLGYLAYFLKRRMPHIKVITYFHNDEVKYFYAQKRTYWIKHIILKVIVSVQQKAIKYSDYCLFISRRELNSLLSNSVTPGDVLPIFIEDAYTTEANKKDIDVDDYFVFFGSAFEPNVDAVRWLVSNIMPFVHGKLLIIGKGFENYSHEFTTKNVEVVGSVISLRPYIEKANFILAPVFKGAGVKIKIAESMMYGKKVIANKLALEGYDCDNLSSFIICCETEHDFITEINTSNHTHLKFIPEVRNDFLVNYNRKNAKIKMEQILGKI